LSELREQQERLELVLDVMWGEIHRVLKWARPDRKTPGKFEMADTGPLERALVGIGVTAPDILSDAAAAFLAVTPGDIQDPKKLAVRIAANKTKDALDKATKGLRATRKRPALQLVSGDRASEGHVGDIGSGPSILDALSDPEMNPEEEVANIERTTALTALAREILSEREQRVLFAIMREETRAEVATELGLSVQAIGQIKSRAWKRLVDDPRYPFPEIDGGQDESEE
jgi:DNA-directed RNA polymerase specialized sigma24 family protein